MNTLRICLAAALITGAPGPLRAENPVSPETLRDAETVAAFRALPVQESGRVKPLDTIARFALLRFSGKQTIAVTSTGSTVASMGQPAPVPLNDPATGKPVLNEKGKPVSLSAMEWMLLSWFRPDIAKDLPVFIVDNTDAIRIPEKGKRDRFSYNEVKQWGELKDANGRTPLERARELRMKKADDLPPEERALAKLVLDYEDYEIILSHRDFAVDPLGQVLQTLPPELRTAWTDANRNLLEFLPKVIAYFKAHADERKQSGTLLMAKLEQTWHGALMARTPANVLRIFPPAGKEAEVWEGPGTLMDTAMRGGTISATDAEFFARYSDLLNASDATLSGRAKAFVDSVTAAARARGEATRIGLEVGYHKTEYFYNALLYFFGALIIVALSWLAPRGFWGRWCVRISVALMVAGAAYSVVGIVIRCIIMQRPPVTSLYETILFITTAAVVFGLVTEWVMRKGIALAMACLAGTVGMFISLRFMNMETMTLGSTDTMKPLEAVLITTFWLATHVPTINLGYAAGMMAAILSMFYFLVRLLVLARVLRADRAGAPAAIVGHGIGFLSRLGKPKDAPGRELLKIRDINRIAYAFVCAGLFLSLVGTVLGGIWANYSWGRFWGWDPKENGALMIVLMNLVILHARVGGYIREVGFHACNIILGMITVFSWFGTNQLGIGLHSYGTLTGVWWWIYAFWASQLGVLAFAALLAFLDRSAGAGKEGHAVEPRVAGGSVQAG